ncbi:MAG: hypothetical protein AB1646_25600 [Thermodesulfobacteriota bacterium]
MNHSHIANKIHRLLCLCGLMITFTAGVTLTDLQAADTRAAIVEAIEGEADISTDRKPDLVKLQRGDPIDLWSSVSTGAGSKLLVRWDDASWVSMGQFSSLSVSDHVSNAPPGRSVDLTEGIVRISSLGATGVDARPYSVTTPLVIVQPESFTDPVDFVVEVYDPTTAVVTVGKGRVRVFRFGQDPSQGKLVSACQNAYVEGEDTEITVLPVAYKDLIALVGEATIPRTIAAIPDECERPPAQAELPVAPPVTVQPWRPEVEVDYWDIVDDYPYQEIRIISPPPYVGSVTVFVPGIGELVVPVVTISGWTFDPEVVLVCVRRAVVERIVLYDRYYWDDLILRRQELNNLIYINRYSGRHQAVWQARQELAYLNTRLNWAGRRIARLERRVADLEHEGQRRLARDAQRVQIYNQVANSFNAPANAAFVRSFRTRLNTQETLQSRFAYMSGQELSQFGRSVSRERDPQRRLALRSELLRVRNQVSDGRLSFTERYRDVGTLANRLAKEKDIQAREKLETQMVTQLNRSVQPVRAEPIDRSSVETIRRQIANDPDAQRRKQLEQRFTQLEQSRDSRKQNQATMEKIEEVSAKVAAERNPEKRKELLGSMKDLWVPALGAVPLGLGLLERHRRQAETSRPAEVRRPPDAVKPRLEPPSSQADALRRQQQERTRQADEQLRLDEQRKKADALRREEEKKREEVSKQDQRARQKQEELQRRKEQQERLADEKRRLREEQKKQSDLRRQQQEEQRRATQAQRGQQEDQKRKADELRRQEQSQKKEQDRARQAEPQRLQQEEQKRKREQAQQAENQRRESERQRQQADQLRKQQDQQRKQQEQLRVQEEQRKNQDRARQAEAQRKQAEQQRLQQQEQKRRQDQVRQEESRRREAERQKQQADQLRKQQDQQRKQQEQMRLQDEQRKNQERARAADAQRRQAEEQTRQAEQARKQQEQQRKQQEQQLRRQDEQRNNQERARAADVQRKQAEDRQRQADQVRRQQEQHRIEQDRARQGDIQRRQAEDSKRKADQVRKQQEEQKRLEEQQRRR